jgi:hypothetical protein
MSWSITEHPMRLFITVSLLLVLISGCNHKQPEAVLCPSPATHETREPIAAPAEPDTPITIIVHGTDFLLTLAKASLPESLSALVAHLRGTLGLKSGEICAHHPSLALARALNKSAPAQFPLDGFYFFDWSGLLNAAGRKAAAQELYSALEYFLTDSYYTNSPITLIAYSHGGNVSLNLAPLAHKSNLKRSIDRLVLLACPVQDGTEHLTASPLFKQIYHFYTPGDWFQVAGYQGLSCSTLFSRREFKPLPSIKQACVT